MPPTLTDQKPVSSDLIGQSVRLRNAVAKVVGREQRLMSQGMQPPAGGYLCTSVS